MRSFKKALLKVLVFILVFSLLCTPSLYAYFKYGSANNNYMPDQLKEEGKVDFAICGASQSVWGFIPQIIDEKCSVNSFNASSGLISMEGRYFIIKNFIEKNPIKYLVMDFSYNGLIRDNSTDSVEGKLLVLEHLRGKDRLSYAVKSVKMDEIFQAFYYMFRTGTYTLVNGSENELKVPYRGKGYWGNKDAVDQSGKVYWLSQEKGTYYPRKPFDISDDSAFYLDKIMQLCKEENIKVYFVTTPYPLKVESIEDRQSTLEAHLALAQKYECTFYDFNIYKNKEILFDDKTSFFDVEHLSTEGAVTLTTELAELINNDDKGIGKSDKFYNTYYEYIDYYRNTYSVQ